MNLKKNYLIFVKSKGGSFVAYSPQENGFLSGKYTKETKYEEGECRNLMGRFKPEVVNHNKALLKLIAEFAESKK
ncbi:aldo/keto reductase [Neobacillus sp. NRS-1170]|uniref:aldo/keto reductase n=1 Tax=Neobacillus sp. NRS-1170 TaxID=3233898 RepID=UPI003D2CF528